MALTFGYLVDDLATVTACEGFSSCVMRARHTLGPVALDVHAP